MRRIFLIGYMGAGKTTMGKELSKQSGLSFIDLDHFMEGRYRKTVRQLFEEKGEEMHHTGGGIPLIRERLSRVASRVFLTSSRNI